MQTKTMRYHLTLVRIVNKAEDKRPKKKKNLEIMSVGKDVGKGETLGSMVPKGQPLCKLYEGASKTKYRTVI